MLTTLKFILQLKTLIQRNLSEDINNLCHWFEENELIINLKKGKTETILFGTSKRTNLQETNLTILLKGLASTIPFPISTWALT